ncbi:DUF2975 domain-containing protein [Companilactobacillus muriivasis]|uniref:DUF2975 domain-containing protein n=1 Tax=Companilactobacillus muriivasis TaxID=3081444 RepID=UPI0030C6D8ED
MKLPTLFLRFTLCIMIFLLTIISLRSFPSLLIFMNENKTSLLILVPYAVLLYTSAILSYGIIIFAWRLLYLTDHDRLFSKAGVLAVKIIKIFFYTIAVIYVLAIFGVCEEANILNAPAPITIELFLIILGLTIGVFVNVLQKIMEVEILK